MLSLAVLVVLQSKNLNPGPYTDYDGKRALSVWLPLIRSEATYDYASRLGTNSRTLRTLRNRVGARMVRPDLDHIPGTSVEELAKKLKVAAREAAESPEAKPDSLLETFLIAEGIVDWVRSHVVYNTMLVSGKIGAKTGMSPKEEHTFRSQYWTPKMLLQKRELFAVCAGFSRLTYQLGKSAGVPIYNIKGFTRSSLQDNGTFHTNQVDHSWNVLFLSDSTDEALIIPTDPSSARVGLSIAREKGFDWCSASSFPDTPDDAVAFHYWHYGTEVEDFMSKVSEYQPTTLTERQWREMGTITVIDQYRSTLLRMLKTATSDRMPE